MPAWCDTCCNTGEIDCHYGGDLCVCGAVTFDCPSCHGMCGDNFAEPDDESGE